GVALDRARLSADDAATVDTVVGSREISGRIHRERLRAGLSQAPVTNRRVVQDYAGIAGIRQDARRRGCQHQQRDPPHPLQLGRLHRNPPLGSTLLHATREPVGDATRKTSSATPAYRKWPREGINL